MYTHIRGGTKRKKAIRVKKFLTSEFHQAGKVVLRKVRDFEKPKEMVFDSLEDYCNKIHDKLVQGKLNKTSNHPNIIGRHIKLEIKKIKIKP